MHFKAIGQFFNRNRDAPLLAKNTNQLFIPGENSQWNLELNIAQGFDLREVRSEDQISDANG